MPALVRSFRGVAPRLGSGVYLAETAVVVGDVELGDGASVWFGSVLRGESQVEGERSGRIRRRPDGHFSVKAQANGVSVTMLVDTGASTVVLKPADAQRLGIDVDRLRYVVPVQTANGTTYAAHARLRNVTLGPISLDGVEALVAKPGALKENLLGMSFLSRLRSYEFTTDMLTLRS